MIFMKRWCGKNNISKTGLSHRSPSVITGHPIKQRLLVGKQAKTGTLSTVEEKPTLYSLFNQRKIFKPLEEWSVQGLDRSFFILLKDSRVVPR